MSDARKQGVHKRSARKIKEQQRRFLEEKSKDENLEKKILGDKSSRKKRRS